MSQSTSGRSSSHSTPGGKGESPLEKYPHDPGAERALVACVLLDPMAAKDECLDIIEDQMFMHPGYRKIINIVKELIKKGETVDLVAIQPHLPESIGPIELAEIYGETVPSANAIMTHFNRVVEVMRRREYFKKGARITHKAGFRGKEGDSNLLRQDCEETIESAEQIGALPRVHSIKDCMEETMKEIAPANERPESTVIPVGMASLDEMLVGGVRPGHLYVIAARPSMGKTTLAWNMAANMALRDEPVLFVSLETRETDLVQGLISRSSGVNSYHLLRGTYDAEAAEKIRTAAREVERLPLYICDDSRVTMSGLRTIVRAARSKYGIKAVFLDYLQLVTPDKMAQETRQVQVSMISRDAKLLSMEQKVPVIMLAQLSRKPESRDNKRPMLSDLRESGSIEQDADVVGLIYRDDYYNKDGEGGKTEIIVAKQRHGPTGTIKLRFNPAIGEFLDYDSGCLEPW